MSSLFLYRYERAVGVLKKVLPIVAFVILLAASTYHLSQSPAIWLDEGMFTQTALNLERYGTQSIQTAPGEFISAGTTTGGFPFIAPISLSYKLFGAGVLQGRAVMVIFILAFAAASYALIYFLFDTWSAGWSVLLLSSFAMLYGNGKSVLAEVPGLLFLVLTALALIWLERSSYRNTWAYIAAGLATGLCVVTKPIFLLLLPALALAWALRWRQVHLRLGGFLLATLALFVPLGIWFHLQFGGNDSLASILSFYANPYDVANLSALVLHNMLQFVTAAAPAYTLILLLLWSSVLFLRHRSREQVSVATIVLFLFSILIVLAFLRLPGWYRYLFPAITVALLFLQIALTRLFEWGAHFFPWFKKIPWLPYALLACIVCGQLYQVAFVSYVAEYYHSTRTQDLIAMLAEVPSNADIFVYNVPEVVVLLGNRPYYQYLKPVSTEYGEDQLPRLTAGDDPYVILATADYHSTDPQFARYRPFGPAGHYTLLKKT